MQLRKTDFGFSVSFGEPPIDSEQAKLEPTPACLS